MLPKSYPTPTTAVNGITPEQPVEIQVIAYRVTRTERAIIKVPFNINGAAVTPTCEDPEAFDAAYRRFFQARYNDDPAVHDLIDSVLAQARSEDGHTHN